MVWSERWGELWGGGWPDSGGDGRGGDRDCRGDSYRIQYLTCCHFWGRGWHLPWQLSTFLKAGKVSKLSGKRSQARCIQDSNM